MNKPRAFLFDVDNWLGSFSVELMSGEQVKAYLYLLCRAWHEEPAATLPNDNEKLARMARVSVEVWDRIKGPILEQFEVKDFAARGQRLVHEELRASAIRNRLQIKQWVRKIVTAIGRCAHCGTSKRLEVDHIVPFALGGADSFENYQCLCRSCNSRKGARFIG